MPRPRASGRILLVVVAACVAAACGEAGDARRGSTLTGVVDLTIGSMEGDDELVFGRVSGLVLHPDGRIIVSDVQANQVRVFSPAGEFLFAFGREGAGPGEMSGPCCLAFDRDGRLWVRDGGNARYSVFDLGEREARLVRTVKMAHGDVNRWAPVTFDAEGRVIDIGSRLDQQTGQLRTMRFHVDSTGAISTTVQVHAAPQESLAVHLVRRNTPQGTITRYLWQPYGAQELLAYSPTGDFAYALSTKYEIARYDVTGHGVQHIEGPASDGPPVTEVERSEAEKQMDADARWVGGTRASLPFDIPERKPVLSRLFYDLDGRLWVLFSVTRDASMFAHVYDAHGDFLHEARWPTGIDLSNGAIRGDIGLGVLRDSLDVQRIVRLRFGS
jgi:hypothetical protein